MKNGSLEAEERGIVCRSKGRDGGLGSGGREGGRVARWRGGVRWGGGGRGGRW